MEQEYPVFTKEMKKTHTILLPMMLPIHFSLLQPILKKFGYNTELLTNESHDVIDEGLKNVHNDTCYPALLVIGQMLTALKSGKYDRNKVALMITQTGGGCRASNYIFLLRKALIKSGFENVPVISLNFSGLESSPGFRLTLPLLNHLISAMLLGDFLMLLSNSCKPYEIEIGATDKLVKKWQGIISENWGDSPIISSKKIKALYPKILDDFALIPKTDKKKIKVGIVGEIYVKYSPMGNNHLEDFLLAEGAEPVVPGVVDFFLYCVYNFLEDKHLYGGSTLNFAIFKSIYTYLLNKQNDMLTAIKTHGVFTAPMGFEKTNKLASSYINHGAKMGEGWLLTAEMAELLEEGIENIVCTQPFGCLPNHIVGKGMINKIKERHPSSNIVAIDYDPGASEINQQNRIKMMLANARQV